MTEAPAVSLMALHFLHAIMVTQAGGDVGAKPSSSFFLIDSQWNVQFQVIVCDVVGSDWNVVHFCSVHASFISLVFTTITRTSSANITS